jgi:ubiquinone/menaquinone biosynthesis C-methylase UbiE
MPHDFSDVERFAVMFDAPDRDGWQRPADVVRLLDLREGMTVVDLGAGTGYFLRHLSPAVGATGRVVGADVEPAMVRHMIDRIAREGLGNATASLVAFGDALLPDASVDRVLVVDTWHHIEDRVEYTRRLARALRPDGAIVVVDFTMESEQGPPAAMRLPPERVVSELSEAGLPAQVVDEPLPFQYVIVARRR